ncbi:hypothetical protein LTR36_001861 [Oleoguttula mirabilis]|uniref:FCP1 homology domain-containing protein n=1 Tax=Oleoguttula mirabilis TaxID=1507867 RepID=A0AAV9JMQ2_9PEZI|nr:hypothetical protein LTR36_001861 [Oleoguttula mirabilis]
MSSSGAPPAAGGLAQSVSTSLSQPLVPPPRTSSREPSVTGDESNAQRSGSSRGQDAAGALGQGQTLAVPGQAGQQQESGTGLNGDTANNTAESGERAPKRSLTGRRRDASTGSKRAAAATNEKVADPTSVGQAQSSARPKKKGGFLAFLNCCGGSDASQDDSAQEMAQAPKPVAKPLPTKAQQPVSTRQQQDVSAADTSAAESKEVIDEKAVAPTQYSPPIAAPILPAPESGRTGAGDATSEKPVPDLPAEASPVQNNAEIRALEEPRQPTMPAEPVTSPPYLNTSAAASDEQTLDANPHVQVQAATPVIPQSAEEQVISDQTPQQRAVDQDIEMRDADQHGGPSLPLTGTEAAAVAAVGGATLLGGGVAAEEVHHQRESRESSRADETLPPPPPLPTSTQQAQQQDVQAGDGNMQSQGALTSTRDETQKWLLPPLRSEHRGRKCLVLDLDETLVHSSFKILHQADFTIPVEIEGQYHNVYVIKRPGVDAFMKRVGELYEVVVFTASVSKYGDPLLDQLDIHHVVHHRLFRESCYNHQGNYVKDLSMVGRDLRETIIIDNSPTSYIFHPQHAVPISSWFSDAHDNELLDLIPVLEDLAGDKVSDVSLVLDVAL